MFRCFPGSTPLPKVLYLTDRITWTLISVLTVALLTGDSIVHSIVQSIVQSIVGLVWLVKREVGGTCSSRGVSHPAMATDSVIEVACNAIANNDAPQRSSQRNKISAAKVRENREIEDFYDKLTAAGTKATKRTARSAIANEKQPGEGKNGEITVSEMAGWQKVVELVGNLTDAIGQQ